MEKTIRVTGYGEVCVAPDTIKVNFEISEVHKDYATSLKNANDKVEELKKSFTLIKY